jgi:hypothetical protein
MERPNGTNDANEAKKTERPPVKLFQRKIRTIPESYLRETMGKDAAAKTAHREWTPERLRSLGKTLRFLAIVVGLVPSAIFLVNLLGYVINGIPDENLQEIEILIPIFVLLAVSFVGWFLSTLWELQGGIVLIVASVVLFVMMNVWMQGADPLQLMLYPIPFLVSGCLSIAHRVSKSALAKKLAAGKA